MYGNVLKPACNYKFIVELENGLNVNNYDYNHSFRISVIVKQAALRKQYLQTH